MNEMDLDGMPAPQPEDPFKGDAAVTAEQPEREVQAEQAVHTEPVTGEAQPQPAEETKAAEKPKWIKAVEIVSVVCLAAAGLLAALFMCLLSIKSFGSNLMLSDIASNLNTVTQRIVDAGGSFEGMQDEVTALFVNFYALLTMLGGIITGCIFAIILITI